MSALIAILALAQPAPSAREVIREARALADAAEAFAEKNALLRKMFMQPAPESAEWVKMERDDAHLDQDGMWSAGDVAFYWTQPKRLTRVLVSKGSMSGDWSASGAYTYRADGSLAKVEIAYSAFSPVEGSVRRERIYGRDGLIVHEGVKIMDLEVRAMIPGERADELKSYQPDFEAWTRRKDLPFWSQVQG